MYHKDKMQLLLNNSSLSSFSKIPNQSIDIQKELKLWQSKMENSKTININSNNNSNSNSNSNNNSIVVENPVSNPNLLSMNSNSNSVSSDLTTQVSLENADSSKSAVVAAAPVQNDSKLTYAIRELINTERDYVNDLSSLIDRYMEAIKRNEIPMPQDMEGGKDKIVFGNIQQIYEWHQTIFAPELEKCLTEPTDYIGRLFTKYENRFQMYVKYCENKPKSEYIVSEYDEYFEQLRVKLNQKLNIQDLLIKPVQRIMKYQLMLKEIKKYMDKEVGKHDCTSINRAIEIMIAVPKNADDMMNVGRLQGFEGRITAQGRLLLQDTLLVQEPEDAKKENKKKESAKQFKERRVFLFQQIVIFSEMIGSNKKFTSPRYIFKLDLKVNKLQLQKDDAQFQFTLKDKTPESTKKILCQCEDQAKYQKWIVHLQELLDMQNNFLNHLQNPQAAMQKGGSSSSGGNPSPSGLGSSHGSSSHHRGGGHHQDSHNNNHTPKSNVSNNSNNNSSSDSSHHHGPLSRFNEFLNSTFSFSNSSNRSSSSTVSPKSKSTSGANNNSSDLTKNQANNNSGSNSALASVSSAPVFTSVDSLNNDLAQKLSMNNSSGNSGSNIPNSARVVVNYAAITEDEITVQKGDLVQIITANMHNRFLVHREANELQPAAEGWIPGHVIGFQSTNSVNPTTATFT